MKAPLFVVAAFVTALSTGHAAAVDTTGGRAAVDTATDESVSDPEPWIADYEGTDIDMRDGWDGARACNTDGETTTCWDTEPEMLLALAAQGLSTTPTADAAGASTARRQYTCSTYLRLYTGTNYSGSVLAISSRYVVLNLSSYGFNNVTSSYRIGACSSAFWDLNSGGAPAYGGNTGVGVWSPNMLSGWDNRISSVYQG